MIFERLFTPIVVGPLELRNRVVMAALHLGYESGDVSQRSIGFLAARARGGVALVVTGGCTVQRAGSSGDTYLRLDDDRFVPGMARLADAIHTEGALLAVQLMHAGMRARSRVTGTEPLAPSAVFSKTTRETARAMTVEEIQGTIAAFATATHRARVAGADAVEILGSEGYLVGQFLSPLTNLRDDEYGGDFDRRSRFGLELVRAVQREAGRGMAILFRISTSDLLEGGTTEDEIRLFSRRLQDAGVDAIDCTVGWHESPVPTIYSNVPRAAFAHLAAGIRSSVTIPVAAANRIPDPWTAERLLRMGYADMVALGRPLIADPEWANKAREGRSAEIVPCIACNRCLDDALGDGAVECTVNPIAGREVAFAVVTAPRKEKVAVVGAGPAGMEAARALAERGHAVTLLEARPRIGGQLNLASMIPGKEDFEQFIRYMEAVLPKLGVEVLTKTPATIELLQQGGYSAVVVGTGIRERTPEIPGVNGPNVCTAFDVLRGRVQPLGAVAIVGAGGVGCDTALFLAHRGRPMPWAVGFLQQYHVPVDAVPSTRITLLRRGDRIADRLGRTVRWIVIQELRSAGVEVRTGVAYREITPDGIWVEAGGREELVRAGTVVLAAGQEPENRLYRELLSLGVNAVAIGGARLAGELNLGRAVEEGNAAARTLFQD